MIIETVNGMKTRFRVNWRGKLVLQVQDSRLIFVDSYPSVHTEPYWRDARPTDLKVMTRDC